MTKNSKKAPAGDSVQSSDQLHDSAANGAAAGTAVDRALARATRGGIVRGDVALEQLAECPWNPRTGYDKAKLEELAESIRQVGLLEPLIVRPSPGKSDQYEIVCGHRRFRAAKVAGLAEVPVEIRELDDETVLEIQLVENVQRADLSPIDEAKGFRRMIDVHKLTADEVAERVAISRSSVYERLRLLELPDQAAKAVIEGRLPASTAGLLVRIADPKARMAAAAAILAGDVERSADGDGRKGPPEPMSFRTARELVRREFLLELKNAPWSLEDLELMPKAGSCTLCPKRTGNMKEAGQVLGDLRPDVCTDSGCFKSKLEAIWLKRSSTHKGLGGKVLSEGEAKGLFPKWGNGVVRSDRYVDLDEKPNDYQLGLEGRKTWRAILKGVEFGPLLAPAVLARSPAGMIFELAPMDAARKAAKAAMPKQKRAPSSASDQAWKKRQATADKKAKAEREALAAIMRGFQARPASEWPADPKAGTKIIRCLGQVLAWLTEHEDKVADMVGQGRHRAADYAAHKKAHKAALARISSPSATEAMRATVELALNTALVESLNTYRSKETSAKQVVDDLLQVAGLDRKKLEAAAAKEAEKPSKEAGIVKKLQNKIAAKAQRVVKKRRKS